MENNEKMIERLKRKCSFRHCGQNIRDRENTGKKMRAKIFKNEARSRPHDKVSKRSLPRIHPFATV
jgi:hypothetical protein